MLDRIVPPPIKNVSFTFRKPEKHLLSNGILLNIIKAEGEEVLRIDFVFSAGQWHQTQKLQALFTCRMLREGCREYSSSAFAERLDYYGAWLELSVAMNRTFVTLYTLKKFFVQTLDLVHSMLLEPLFVEEQLNLVKANNKAQFMVNMQKGDIRAMRALRSNVYGENHPCGLLTEPDDYDVLQQKHLKDFYARYYGACNCTIFLSGSVDDEVINRVDMLFGTSLWGASQRVGEVEYSIIPSDCRYMKIVQSDAVQSSLRMGCLLMDVNDEDYLSMRVLTTIFGGYFGSRLMKNVREEKGYTYHIGADLLTQTPEVFFMISCEALADKTDEVIAQVHAEMVRLQTERVSDEELQVVRNYMIGEICRNYEGAFSLIDAYIYLDNLGLPETHIEQTVEAIRSIDSVRLQHLAKRYLCPENLYTAAVCP